MRRYLITHPIIAAELLGAFGLSPGKTAHYAELCMSWIDSLPLFQFKTSSDSLYRKVFGNCPIDMSVYDSGGKLVGQIVNDTVQEIEGGVSSWIDDDGQKVFILPPDGEYSIQMNATDNGKVTYTVADYNYDSGLTERVVSYSEIPVVKNDCLVSTVPNIEANADAIGTLSDETTQYSPDFVLSGNEVTRYTVTPSASEGGQVSGGGSYVVGEFAKVIASPDPNASFEGWYINNQILLG